jgi:hypothetical protein
LRDALTESGIEWKQLPDPDRLKAENAWRHTYGRAFRVRPRVRQGAKAELEYHCQTCDHYLIIPFSARVPGLPVTVVRQFIAAYECHGPLIPLGTFHSAEFFICPPDLSWSMIHTHEDHGFGGPYFIRADWVPWRN